MGRDQLNVLKQRKVFLKMSAQLVIIKTCLCFVCYKAPVQIIMHQAPNYSCY